MTTPQQSMPMADDPSLAPRQFAGRRASGTQSPGGDGSPSANGMQTMPQRPQPAFQTAQPPAAQGQGTPPQTFAQMQASGQARPAPPPQDTRPSIPVGGQLQQAVGQALQTPSRYDLPQVQQVQQGLTGQLQQQFGAQQQQLDEEMARRGIGASSIASGYNGDLAGQQANAMATMTGGLIQNAAQTNAQDRASALGAGQAYQTGEQGYGLGQQSLGLQSDLGHGSLGVQQGQLSLAQAAQSQNYGLASAAQQLNQQVQMGQLSLAQANQQLAQLQNQQQYGLASNAQNIQQNQFGQSFGLQQQAQENQANQFGQSLGLQQQQVSNQAGQFGQSLAQQLGLATMSDKTANRGVDAQASLANNQLMYQVLGAMGGMDPAMFKALLAKLQSGGSGTGAGTPPPTDDGEGPVPVPGGKKKPQGGY